MKKTTSTLFFFAVILFKLNAQETYMKLMGRNVSTSASTNNVVH